jgi:hypothetical protein
VVLGRDQAVAELLPLIPSGRLSLVGHQYALSLHSTLRRRSVLLASTSQFSQLLITSDKLSEAAIQADQQSSKCPNRGRHKVFRTGEVDVKFRRKRALID